MRDGLEQVLPLAIVPIVPKQDTIGGLAVAPGATDLLMIDVHRRGHAPVEHETHVGLVDAHAEGDGGDHNVEGRRHGATKARRIDKGLLDGSPCRIVEAGVIGGCADSGLAEHARDTLGLAAGDAVDNSRRLVRKTMAVFGLQLAHFVNQIAVGAQAVIRTKEEFGAIEGADEDDRFEARRHGVSNRM